MENQNNTASLVISNDSSSHLIYVDKNTDLGGFYQQIILQFPKQNNIKLFYYEGYSHNKLYVSNEQEYVTANKKCIEYFYLCSDKSNIEDNDKIDYLKYHSVIAFSPIKKLNKEKNNEERKEMQVINNIPVKHSNSTNNINNNMNNNMNNMNNSMKNDMNNNMNNNYGLPNADINIPSSQSMGNINMNNPQQQQQQQSQKPRQEQDELEGNIPRSEETIYDTHDKFAPDADIRTIEFEASTGLKVVINVDTKITTIKDLIKRYIKKIGINESLIGNGILFLMHGKKLDHNSQNLVATFPNNPKINVLDQNYVIGGYLNIKLYNNIIFN